VKDRSHEDDYNPVKCTTCTYKTGTTKGRCSQQNIFQSSRHPFFCTKSHHPIVSQNRMHLFPKLPIPDHYKSEKSDCKLLDNDLNYQVLPWAPAF
jgi:hypothetical protein